MGSEHLAKTLKLFSLAILIGAALVGCASAPPISEYSLARTAIQSAKEFESPKYASGFWYKAEQHYLSGQKAFKENDFALARDNFIQARRFAERAENITRLKRFQTGEALP